MLHACTGTQAQTLAAVHRGCRWTLASFFAVVLAGLMPAESHSTAGRLGLSRTAVAQERPNFLLIVADDLGFGDVSYQRSDSSRDEGEVRTPNIDRIGAEGMRFANMRANCTVCSPSRAAILSGRYPNRVGVPGVIRTHAENSWGFLAPSVPTLANVLGDAGYDTAIVGKWHLGLESPNTPNERGFDFFHGFLGDMMDDYWNHRRHGNNYMRLNGEEIDPEGHATDLFAAWAADYLRQRGGGNAAGGERQKPFFLYLAFNAPHFPIQPPAEWLERVRERAPQMDEKRAANVAFVEHLDAGIGRVLDALRESGLESNTIVVFTSDNGGSLPHGQNNDPWRDGKQSHYDGGLRVPFAVRWPQRIEAGSRSDYVGLSFDVYPTFVELAGAAPPAGLDAVSLVPAFSGKPPAEARELYFTRREGGPRYGGKSYDALIRGDWKLMQNDPYSPLELYNLKEDPQESRNLIDEKRQVARGLQISLQRHIQRGGEFPWQAAD
ncbi:sulfatase family protein [Candidatus Laterigemmans baculatus]|uniref:sulfatase family protein n=1 Tax=Candidatus Laterigemmans baculatus TaxID=2770505 RepID=UPI001F2AECC2|nr:sulfatase-like hydrolase/transferase [Candidatus Laterigemmans baculatus]